MEKYSVITASESSSRANAFANAVNKIFNGFVRLLDSISTNKVSEEKKKVLKELFTIQAPVPKKAIDIETNEEVEGVYLIDVIFIANEPIQLKNGTSYKKGQELKYAIAAYDTEIENEDGTVTHLWSYSIRSEVNALPDGEIIYSSTDYKDKWQQCQEEGMIKIWENLADLVSDEYSKDGIGKEQTTEDSSDEESETETSESSENTEETNSSKKLAGKSMIICVSDLEEESDGEEIEILPVRTEYSPSLTNLMMEGASQYIGEHVSEIECGNVYSIKFDENGTLILEKQETEEEYEDARETAYNEIINCLTLYADDLDPEDSEYVYDLIDALQVGKDSFSEDEEYFDEEEYEYEDEEAYYDDFQLD